MDSFRRKGASALEVLNYSYPVLHKGKIWYVDFRCYDPIKGVFRRKKYHISAHLSVREKQACAANLIAALVERLRSGWNPWTQQASEKQYITYSSIRDIYKHYLRTLCDKKSIRIGTYNSYLSFLNIFDEWVQRRVSPLVYVYQLDAECFTDFLDYLLLEKDVSSRTRNNYLLWISTFCAWLVEKGALDVNPAANIRKLREGEKFREQFSAEQLADLRTYLEKHDRRFLLACMFEYYTFIRPEELCSIKIQDISIKGQKVCLSGEFTKNRKDAAVALNDDLIRMMIDLDVFSYPGHFFLFGGRDFRPGEKKQMGRIFREAFQKLRKRMGLDACYQFYSLKDTGIRDLANSKGIVVARDQARHSDVKTTNKYLKGDDMVVHEEAKHFSGNL
ncbi:MAG: site-specific integrase [Bacteroidaceae bacterium]|nr:site-specific integrase [Bacteroidaceae bacterium]